MIYEQVTQSSFIDAFRRMGRGEQFSYDALCALFDWYDGYNAEFDHMEFDHMDVIDICCDWAEYDTALEAAIEYGFVKRERDLILIDYDDPSRNVYEVTEEELEADDEYAQQCEDAALEWLSDRTTALALDDSGVVILQF